MYLATRKYRTRTSGPGTVVISMIAAAALSGSCFFGTTTNLCEISGRRCRAGQVCAANQDACIDIGGCGDGVTNRDEVCDDGNVLDGDGCSADCTSDETCGNNIVDKAAGESCDGAENCSPDCTLQSCGNGIADVNENCDTGGDSRTCDIDCTYVECGDGHVNTIAHEDCDTGAAEDTPICDGDCTMPRCGDKHTNPNFIPPGNVIGEQCDTDVDTASCDNDCTLPVCGDGHFNPNFTIPNKGHKELCDGGMTIMGVPTPMDSSTCNDDCTPTKCGDHHTNAAAGELCDDGNNSNNDDCPDGTGGSCKPAVCGDGFKQTQGMKTEECDNGANNSDTGPDACRTNCRKAFCGDGVKDSNEVCDPNDQASCASPKKCGNQCQVCN